MEQARLSLVSYGPHKEKYQKAKLQPGADIPLHVPLSTAKLHIGAIPSSTLMSVTMQQIDAGLSRTHCIIERTLGEGKPSWYLTDMSTNGTYIDDVRCEFGKPCLLTNMSVVVFGDPQVSALRYQFSTGAELGKRQREGRTTPVLVDAKRLFPIEEKQTNGQDDQFANLQTMEKVLRRAIQQKPEDTLCAHCKEIVILPLDLPCKHIICFLCYDIAIFQGQKSQCEVCKRPLEAYKLPVPNLTLQQRFKDSASAGVLALLRPLEQAISQRETHILRILRLREAGYQKAIRESREPLDSPFLSSDYLDIFTRRLRVLSPAHKSSLLRAQGLTENTIERAEERHISLIVSRLCLEEPGDTTEEKRKTLLRLIGNM